MIQLKCLGYDLMLIMHIFVVLFPAILAEDPKKSEPASCNCGWKNLQRIVGGTETGINEFPMMAGLVDLKKGNVFCGGTIIAKTYILSAAHCFPNREPNTVGILVGDHDISKGSETSSSKLLRSSKFIVHPDYDTRTQHNDIAIVQTETEIEYNFAVGPACLPFYYKNYSFEEQTVELLGWGNIKSSGSSSDVLLKTDVEVLDYDTCEKMMRGTAEQLCTYGDGHDACQKDSGGPVLWTDKAGPRVYVIGIISSGRGCASYYPGVSIRVTSYLPWIMSKIPKDDVCVKGP